MVDKSNAEIKRMVERGELKKVKFALLKEYPDSPVKGYIVEFDEDTFDNGLVAVGNIHNLHIGTCLENPEYWQVIDYIEKHTMKDEIESMFLDLCGRIWINTPDNYEDIVQFIYEDILDTRVDEEWTSEDFNIAFRRYLESK